MWNHIKIEILRAFKSKGMIFGLLAGCGIALIQIFIDVSFVLKYLHPISESVSAKDIMFPHTVFQHALAFNFSSSITFYYYMAMPILAAIPFAVTLYKDQKSGYIKNVFTRTPKLHYYVAQYFAAFLSAGTIAVIPQILNVLVVALILPSTKPYPGIGYVGVLNDCMLSSIYYKNPYLYLLVFLLIDFVVFGLLNTLALSFSDLMKSEFSVLMIPFLIMQFIEFVTTFLGAERYSLLGLIMPSQPYIHTSIRTVIIYCMLMIIIDCFSIWKKLKRDDWYE